MHETLALLQVFYRPVHCTRSLMPTIRTANAQIVRDVASQRIHVAQTSRPGWDSLAPSRSN